MPNVITGSQVIFWIIWVNAIFIFTLVLPHQASYIFPFKSGVTIFKMFKKITNSDDSSETDKKTDKKIDDAVKNAAAKKVQAVFREKRAAQLEDVISDEKTLAEKIDNRRNPAPVVAPVTAPEKTGASAGPAKPPEKTEGPADAGTAPDVKTGSTTAAPSTSEGPAKPAEKTGAPAEKPAAEPAEKKKKKTNKTNKKNTNTTKIPGIPLPGVTPKIV